MFGIGAVADTEDIINRRVHKITLQFHNAIDDNVIVAFAYTHASQVHQWRKEIIFWNRIPDY